jgi:septal ring factor EnvC (AmiA/AmiB activator)
MALDIVPLGRKRQQVPVDRPDPKLLDPAFLRGVERALGVPEGPEAFAPPKDRERLGALAANAAMQEATNSADKIDTLITAVEDAVHDMSNAARSELEQLHDQMQQLDQILNETRSMVRATSQNFRTFGSEVSARIQQASELSRRVMAQCEAISSEIEPRPAAVVLPKVREEKSSTPQSA